MTKAEFYRDVHPTSRGPLEGLIVLEACTTYAGPVAAAELADLGAEVIKCELPVTGDVCRLFGPRVPKRSAAAVLGQHNAEIYGSWLGYDEATLAELAKEEVI